MERRRVRRRRTLTAVRARIGEIVSGCHDPARPVRCRAALPGGDPADRGADRSYTGPPGLVRAAAIPRVPEGKAVRELSAARAAD
ncbi:hypothetical protein [Streptomyces sp. NBC_01794]|uniref:hypothetical protein n=1 Tax=Streptomyces sp. NBC_01794 TaxID=2975942 RepID=UPI0030935E6E|nr:hypothetical protein OIE54_35965 [Streptomyces sp. NBC_01794]